MKHLFLASLTILSTSSLIAPTLLATETDTLELMAPESEASSQIIQSLIKRIESLEKALKKTESKKGESNKAKSKKAVPPVLIHQPPTEKEKELEQRIELLANAFEEKLEYNSAIDSHQNRTTIGGYGELHYNALDVNGEDVRELDFHRMVLFFSHEFNDWARFTAELEVEHILASGGSRGAVELEQVYIEMDLTDEYQLKTGVMLMPLGIINETHEPTAFYGVERPIIEQIIIPTTWWSAGMALSAHYDNGFSYDLFITEGLKTDDPANGVDADPFDIKGGKQKSSFADAFDLAVTGRVKYTAIPGLELALYAQYQPDLDQSAKDSYADAATLIGGHGIYQIGDFTLKGLYARWDLDGEQAAAANRSIQDGGYAEIVWKANPQWGFFARQSQWSTLADETKSESRFGVNFYPFEQVVFKFDYQLQNQEAGNSDGLNLGFGYHF